VNCMSPRPRLAPRLTLPIMAVLAASAAIAMLSCGNRSRPAADLIVTSFAPAETSQGSEPLQVQFDQPIVDDDQVGVPVEAAPVLIEPGVETAAHWLDRQTLIITPTGTMKPSTRYKVSLTGELGKRTGGFSFSFVHEPLVIEGIWGADLGQLPVQPVLPIHFNQPVRVKDVLDRCRLQVKGEKTSIALVAAEGAEDGTQIPVAPASPLERDRDYELTCDKLQGKQGDTPLATTYVQSLHTHPHLFVKSSRPDGDDAPADDVEIELQFSTPVALEEIRKHLSAKPKIVGLDQGWLDRSGTHYKTTVTLKATTKYAITVSTDLKDTFGQSLEKPFALTFITGNARPRLSMETGIYAVEPQSAGYPVWTRNVRDFDVECAVVPKNKIVNLLTSALDYDPWYDAGSSQALEWDTLGLSKREKRVAITKPKDNWHLSNLAMHEVCGASTPRGLFLADIKSRDIEPDPDYAWRYRPHRRVLANVTDLGILMKAGTASGIVWVSQISTGEPVDGANVAIYTPQGRLAHRGKTDKDGILRLPGTTKLLRQPGASDKNQFEDEEYDEYDGYRSQRLIAVVDKGDDLGVLDGNWANGIQSWNFGVRTERASGETRIRGFIQSDRGIYRPGETVHFKGLIREIAVGKEPVVPKLAKVKIDVEDSRGQSVLDETMRLSPFGGFAFDLPLTTEANLGDYYVTATIQGQTFRERFSVEEFRKVSFEVELKGNERHGRLGDKLSFEVDANHLFGAPVTGANVEWNVQRRSHAIHFPSHAEYAFGDSAGRGWWYYDEGDYYDSYYLSYVSDGTGTTDRRGKLRFAVRDSHTKFDGPQDYVVGVSVTDETDQVISKRTVVTAHKSDFYLGLHTQEYVQAVDMPFAVNAVALTPSGERVATRATLKFIRETYSCNYSGGYRSYSTCTTNHEVEIERAIDIPATGAGTERIFPKKPGQYVVRIEATDGRGNEVVSSGNVWIIGKGEAFWSGDESARMALVASKTNYKPGETARLVPRTSLKNATALITLERNGVLDAFVQRLSSSSDGIEIKLGDVHAPNVFASVAMVTGRSGEGDRNRPQFKMGITELKVSSDHKRLDIAITTEKESYQPGEIVNGVVRVLSSGQPVSAEVSVSVADEGVLQLIGYKTPDPMSAFYASWGLGVDASTNWNRIARLDDPAGGDSDEGADSGDGDDGVRSRFVSSAFWAPSLVTDERGEVRFSFTAPDNLTAFRAMAVAADTGSRFGSGEARITIKKPLLAKPVLPRFLNAGDKVEVGVVVHNYTGEDGTAVVNATAKGVSLSNKSRQAKLARDGAARVSFPVTAGKAREATFEFSVEMGGHRDALRLTIPLNQPLIIESKTVASGIAGAGGAETATVPITWDSSLVQNRSFVTVTVDRTGLGELEPSLRYLIEYPYGCLEQTLSRFIPLTKVQDLAESLNMEDLEGPKLKTFIRAGVAKVARHQHSSGHFSLWPSGETYPHLTVYAIYGLAEAKRAGIKVPADVIDRGVAAIKSWTNNKTVSPDGDSATMAMAAYVLAELGQPDTGLNARLFEARRGLPRYGQAFLLRAMKRARARQSDIDTLRDELVGAASLEGAIALLRESVSGLDVYMSSDIRTSAITLSALLEVDPKNALVDKLVAGLKDKQRPGGAWTNTQENLYALVALADYARAQSAGSELLTLSINGKQQIRRRLKGASVLVLRRSLHSYKPGEVKIETTGKVRYDVRLTEAREDPAAVAVDKGFAVTRSYLDPVTGLPLTGFKTGQLVKVRVEIKSSKSHRYVALEDPLPAGFEAVNTRLATSANVSGATTTSGWSWNHIELRDDRMLAFADHMYNKSAQLEYLVRATTPGTFVAPPPRVEEMYSPDVHGRGTAAQVVIKK
jgi:alpha-2-macroglobulin